MTRIKALAIAGVTTLTFLSVGLGVSAYSGRDDAPSLPGNIMQTAPVNETANQPRQADAVLSSSNTKHHDDDDDREDGHRADAREREHHEEDD